MKLFSNTSPEEKLENGKREIKEKNKGIMK